MADSNGTIITVTLAFAGVGWLVLLSGVGASQSHCVAGGYDVASSAGYFIPGSCSQLFGYAWWIVFLQAGVLILCTVGFTRDLMMWRSTLIGLLAIATVLMQDTANSFLTFEHAAVSGRSQAQAALAGAIMSSMANFVLVAAIGFHSDGVVIPNSAMDVPPAPKPAFPHAGSNA